MKQVLSELKFSKEINLIFLSVLFFATSLGINIVCFPAVLYKNGISSTQIGIAVIVDILSGILIASFLSKISSKLGMMKTLFFSSSTYATATIFIYFYQNFLLWLIFCAIMGSAFFAFIITRQAWLNSLLSEPKRSIGLGLFSLIISVGLAIGPVIVNFSGALHHSSFVISSALTFLAFAVIFKIARNTNISLNSDRVGFAKFFKNNSRCFLAKFCLEYQVYFMFAFTVFFGKEIGISAEKSGLLITAFTIGGIFDLVVGFLLKKFNPYKLINIGSIGCLTFFIIISLYYNSYTILVISYFLFGSFVSLNHISSFTIINQDYKKEELVAANSTFQAIGSIGALSSAIVGGMLMGILGFYGFILNLILGCTIYLIYSLCHRRF